MFSKKNLKLKDNVEPITIMFVQEFLFDPSSLVVLTLFGHAVIICRSQSVN